MKKAITLFVIIFIFLGNILFAEDVVIGTQKWMPKNIDVSTYRDGTPIRHAATAEEWIDADNKGEGAWCYYNNDPSNGAIYGKLYNWYAVNDPRGLAPEGYHVPSDEEWTTLENYLRNNSQYWCNNNSQHIAKSLASKDLWTTYNSTCAIGNNLNANNSSGFSALPGNCRYYGGDFYPLSSGYWWSATEDDESYAWGRRMRYDLSLLYRSLNDKVLGFAVRCVKDEEIPPTLINPANNATDQPRNLTFKWETLTGASEYKIQASTNQDFSTLTIDSKTTSTSYLNTNLSNNKTYYWRVRAKKGETYTQWSEVRSFTTVTGSIDLESGLVAYYPFTDGRTDDYSGNGNHGTNYGATKTEDRFGNPDCAYSFDGNDFITVEDDNTLDLYDNFTLGGWFNISYFSSELLMTLLNKERTPGGTGYSLRTNEYWVNAGISAGINWDDGGWNPSKNIMIPSFLIANLNDWYYVVCIYDGQDLKLYVNGLLKTKITCEIKLINSQEPINIGRTSEIQGLYHYGKIDDIRIYNRALSDVEVAALYGTKSVINPQISISKSLLPAGETQVINASGYPANEEVRLHIFRANAIIDTFDIVTDIDGKFTKNYATDSSFYAGRYLVSSWVKSNANISSNRIQFELTKTEPEFEMWVVMPKTGDTLTLGVPFQVVWYDKMNLWGQDSINGTNRYFKYLIEYKKPNADYWIPLDTVSGLASLFTQIMFNTMVTIQDTSDVESIRVIDLTTYQYEQGKSEKDEDELQSGGLEYYRKILINNLYSIGIGANEIRLLASREWDLENLKHWTNNNTSQITDNKPHPLGVVADGNSRIILKLRVENIKQDNPITKVEVYLPNSSSSDVTGKLEYKTIDYGSLPLSNWPVIDNPSFNSNNPKTANCTIQPSEYQTANNGTFYFWYQAPLNIGTIDNYFKENGFREDKFQFKVYFKTGDPKIVDGKMFISLPPLYLVAGVGGNEDGKYWDEFKYYFSIGAYGTYEKPYKNSNLFPFLSIPIMKSSDGYDNRIKTLSNDAKSMSVPFTILQVLKQGLACSQVDWVGHSMGGALGRAFQEKTFNPNQSSIINERTYKKGYLHKLITISSPHIGAPGANILVDWVNNFNNLNYFDQVESFKSLVEFIADGFDADNKVKYSYNIDRVNCGLFLGGHDPNLKEFVRNSLKNQYLNDLWSDLKDNKKIKLQLQKVFYDVQLPQKRNSGKDATGDLIPKNLVINEKGKRFNQIDIPNHLISSNLTFGGFIFDWFSSIKYENQFFEDIYIPKLVKNIFQKPDTYWILANIKDVDALYSKYGIGDETENFLLNKSDVIIGVRSQKNNRDNHLKNFHYYINTVKSYNHGNTHQRTEVGDYVMELLLSPINTDDSKFANVLEAVTQQEIDDPVFSKTQKIKPENENDEQIAFNSQLTLLSPTEGSIHNTDSLMDVSFEISDITGLIGCSIEFQNQHYYADSLSFSNVFKIPVLYDKIGECYLKLSVQFDFNDELITLDTIVKVNVITEDDLLALSVEPKVYTLKVGETFKPTITAYFQKGITDISNSFQEFIDVAFTNDTIVSFDSTYKDFTAINLGTTQAVITYKNFGETIYIDVDGILPVPDSTVVLIAPSDSSITTKFDVLFNWHSVNNTLTYTMELSKDTNFYNLVFDGRELLDTFRLVPELESKMKYYWHVKAVGLGGESEWSETWSFTTEPDKHQIPLVFGWNLISTYVEPDDSMMDDVFSEIEGNTVIVKNNAGQIYYPEFEINDIGNWDVKQGYQVYMSQAETLTISGMKIIPETTEVALAAGWNILAYLRDNAMNIEIALASLKDNDNLIIAKDNMGNVFYPAFEINMIGDMLPGQGYQIFILNDDVLVYPGN